MSPARDQTQTAHSWVQRTITMRPPHLHELSITYYLFVINMFSKNLALKDERDTCTLLYGSGAYSVV